MKSVRILIVKAFLRETRPDLLCGETAGSLDHGVRDFGSAISEAIKWILRSVIDQILSREGEARKTAARAEGSESTGTSKNAYP